MACYGTHINEVEAAPFSFTDLFLVHEEHGEVDIGVEVDVHGELELFD